MLGSLASLAGRLPQALAQLHAFLELEAGAGRLRVVDGAHAGDPAAAIIAVRTALAVAAAGADTLASGLADAHNSVAWITADFTRTSPRLTSPRCGDVGGELAE